MDELFARHYVERPYANGPGFDPADADGLDRIDDAYALTTPEKTVLAAQGFVVVDRVAYSSHPIGYQDIFQRDLPVLVTVDSILFALHKSYDLMLQETEMSLLIPMLDDLLARAHTRLGTEWPSATGPLGDARDDLSVVDRCLGAPAGRLPRNPARVLPGFLIVFPPATEPRKQPT